MAKDRQDIGGVSAVVRAGAGRILLIKTAKAGWELLGGRVEQGEDFLTALPRAVREETGCEIGVGRLTGVTSHTGVPRITIFPFLCRHLAGAPPPVTTHSMRAGLPLTRPSASSPIRSSICGSRMRSATVRVSSPGRTAVFPSEDPQGAGYAMLCPHHG
jgi:ADP-ribose pyrophosphatase YjhB (NUDIX family)